MEFYEQMNLIKIQHEHYLLITFLPEFIFHTFEVSRLNQKQLTYSLENFFVF